MSLLARVQEIGNSDYQNDALLKSEILQKLEILQREIEGPAAYLSRIQKLVRNSDRNPGWS